MPYTATALTRADASWAGHDLDLADVPDLDAAADLLRDLGGPDADLVLLFVEEDDEYFGIVRVDGDQDPRLFVSDRRVLETSDLAGRLFGDALPLEVPTVEIDDGEDDSTKPEAEPGGDPGLLSDLDTSASQLLDLCAEEGLLPSDVIFAVCERAGCVDTLEEVRGGV